VFPDLKMLICSQFLCSTISDHQEIFNPDQLVTADRLEPAVATDSSQALQQMDCDPNQALEKEWSNGGYMHTTEPSRKQENGILRIVPSYSDVRNPAPHQTSWQSC
jgi:transcription factor E2F3